MRADERSVSASIRTSHNGTPCLSAARLKRREAVNESARGLPAISPITKARSRQRSPSSSAKSASSGVAASTWIRRWRKSCGKPCRQGRPVSLIVARSCTHNTMRRSLHSTNGPRAAAWCPACMPSRASASASPAPLAPSPAAKISLCKGATIPGRQPAPRLLLVESMARAGSSRLFAKAGWNITGRLICSLYVPYPGDSQSPITPSREKAAPNGTASPNPHKIRGYSCGGWIGTINSSPATSSTTSTIPRPRWLRLRL